MFKLVVLFAVVAVCSAKPGFLEPAVAYPIATSHSSRIDIHHKPIAYATPIVHAPIVKTVVAPVAPIVKTIVSPAVYPAAAVSHAARVDLHEAVGPVVYGGYGHGFGHELGHGYGHELGHGYGGLDGYYGHGVYGHGLYGHGGYGHYW